MQQKIVSKIQGLFASLVQLEVDLEALCNAFITTTYSICTLSFSCVIAAAFVCDCSAWGSCGLALCESRAGNEVLCVVSDDAGKSWRHWQSRGRAVHGTCGKGGCRTIF